MKVAIIGAGIAGPTRAYRLWRYGHEPTLIQKAPRLRTGGFPEYAEVAFRWGCRQPKRKPGSGGTAGDRSAPVSHPRARGTQRHTTQAGDGAGS